MAKGIEKKVEIERAKKRRASLLAEYDASGFTQFKFATRKKVSAQRMSQLLKMARMEAWEA